MKKNRNKLREYNKQTKFIIDGNQLLAVTTNQLDEVAKNEVLAKIHELNQQGKLYTYDEIHSALNGKYNLRSIMNIILHLTEKIIIIPKYQNHKLVGFTINQGNPPCDECGSPTSQYQGVYVCEACGLEGDKAFVTPEFIISINTAQGDLGRQFVSTGERVDMVDGLGSFIGFNYSVIKRDGQNNLLPNETKYHFNKLKRLFNFRARIKGRESEYRTLKSLRRACSNLQVTEQTYMRAAYLYRKSLNTLSKDEYSTHPVLICACLYTAIKENKEPFYLQQIIDNIKILGHKISNSSVIKTLQQLKQMNVISHVSRKSEDFLSDLISDLLANPEIKSRLIKQNWEIETYRFLLQKTAQQALDATSLKNSGRHPRTYASAALYASDLILAERYNKIHILTQKLIAKTVNVGQYSVRDHYCTFLKEYVNKKISNIRPTLSQFFKK